MKVYTIDGTSKKTIMLKLIEPAISEGAEGAIYKIEGKPSGVVKIYKDINDAKTKQEKLMAMIDMAKKGYLDKSNLFDCVAWPCAPIFDNNYNFIGYGMMRMNPKYDFKALHAYPYENSHCKNLSMFDRIEILINLADVFSRVHSVGNSIVIGDANARNIFVTENNKVILLDADSFTIDYNGKYMPCTVCEPGYVAPEIYKSVKGSSYEQLPRGSSFSKESDNYILAIHIFQVLFRCPPFSYCRTNDKVPSLPYNSKDEKAANGYCVLFKKVNGFEMPPQAPPLSAYPKVFEELFRRAFIDSLNDPHLRPSANEWKQALSDYQKTLKRCENGNNTHQYSKTLNKCPYCSSDEKYKANGNAAIASTTKILRPVITPNNVKHATHNLQNKIGSKMGSPANATISKNRNNTSYWVITMLLTVGAQVVAGLLLYPAIAYDFLDSEFAIIATSILVCLLGVACAVAYNLLFSSLSRGGNGKVYDYILSVVSSFVPLVVIGLIVVAIGILITVAMIALGIFILVELLGG